MLVGLLALLATAPAAWGEGQSRGVPCDDTPPLIGVTEDGDLIRLDPADPATVEVGPKVTGLRDDEHLAALASDPWTWGRDVLFGLTSKGRSYRIDPFTGEATGGEMEPPDPPLPPGADVDIGLRLYLGYDGPFGWAVTSGGEFWAYELFGGDPYLAMREPTEGTAGAGPKVPVAMIAASGGAIDAAGQWLWRYAEYPETGYVREWPLTVPVRSPVSLEWYCSPTDPTGRDPDLLLTAAPVEDRSLLYRVNWNTGVVAPIGPIGHDGIVTDLVLDPITNTSPEFDQIMADVFEGDPGASFELRRSEGMDERASVELDVVFEQCCDDTATAGADFRTDPMTIRLERGEVAARFPLPLIDDEDWEPVREQFQVRATEIRVEGRTVHAQFARTFVLHDDEWFEAFDAGLVDGGVDPNNPPADPRQRKPGSTPKPKPALGPTLVTPPSVAASGLAGRGVPVRLRCGAACRVRLSLHRAGPSPPLAERSVVLARAGSRRVALRTRRRVRPGTRLVLRATGRDTNGRTVRSLTRVRVR